MKQDDEDDEFARIEREAELRKGQPYHFTKRKDDDDDIQDYVRPWVGLTLDERIELAQDVDWAAGAYCEYAEKIEAKLRSKNSG
jgi:hypothetical protein